MSKDTRPFNFTINAAEFFAEIESKCNKKDLVNWIEQFSKDLITLYPKTDYGKKVVKQTIDYIEKQSANGAKGGRPTKTQTKAVVNSGLSQTITQTKAKQKVKEKEEVKEEVKEETTPIPDWIPTEAWNDFTKNREMLKKPMTELSKKKIIKKLGEYKTVYDVEKLLNRATANEWMDIYLNDDCKLGDNTECVTPIWF